MQEQGEWGTEALAINEDILEADPENEAATVRRARCLRALGRLEESLSVLQALVDKRPDNSVARSQAAKTRRRLEAKSRADRLLAEDPSKRILRGVRAADRHNHYACLGLAAVLMDRVERHGDRDKIEEASTLLDEAWAAGSRDAAIRAAYDRLRSLT